MTKYFVDEKEIVFPLNITSLDQILKHVEDSLLPPNSVIRQIHVDGLPLLPETFSEDPAKLLRLLEDRQKVEIYTGTLQEIAHDSIADAIAYLNRVETVTPSLSETFQVSPGPEAFKNLQELYEGFYWLNLLFDKIETGLHIALKDVVIQGIPAKEYQQQFVSILKQLIDSQEKRDYVLISDLLEYEILPLIPIWREMFIIIAGKVNVAQ